MSEEKIDMRAGFASLSEGMRDAEKAYHRVFDNMPKNKAEIVNQMVFAWSCAWAAYNSAMGFNGEDSDETKIMTCGVHASLYFVHFRIVQNLLGNESVENTIKKMDETSRWLEERGWSHLPEPVDEQNKVHLKTASGVHIDMQRYVETRKTLVDKLRQHDTNVGSKRR